jgi:predicted hotdog family 3-hydroxylacyl-ACP dehydratase
MLVPSENILSVIPQSQPFVMIDQLVTCDAIRSTTTLHITAENVLVSDGRLTEAGIIENIAQTAAAGAGYRAKSAGAQIAIGYIGAIKNLEIMALPNVGDMINTEVSITNQVFDVIMVSGKVECNGQVLAECEMKIFQKG